MSGLTILFVTSLVVCTLIFMFEPLLNRLSDFKFNIVWWLAVLAWSVWVSSYMLILVARNAS